MDFGLSEDQVLFKDTLRRYLEAECPTTRVRAIMEGDDGHDRDLWRGLAELGIAGLIVPAEYGGSELEILDLALAAEEMGWAATPGPFFGNSIATAALVASDDEDVKKEWLSRIATGESIATLALSEKIGEWDPDRMETRAHDGRLSGEKPLVPYAAVSDVLLVAAKDEDGAGIWLVGNGASGMTTTTLHGNDMTRRLDAVAFDNTPAVKIASGRAALDRARDVGLVLLAADSYGGSARSLHMTSDYALTREQFGQVIGAFQGVKHQLANMATELEPALSLWWYTAHALDHIQDKAERHAALTKAHLTDVFDMVSRYAIELHGGIGFTWEYDLHLWFRRALFNRSYMGTASYHRKRAGDLAGW